MVGEILAALLAVSCPQDRALEERLAATDGRLAALLEIERRVRGGALPSADELELGRTTREQVLGGIDSRQAAELGFKPADLRHRLLPGFTAELKMLADQRALLEVGAAAERSPLYVIILDLEQELFQAADKRRQRLGLKSPFETGPLSHRLHPEGAATPAATDAAASAPSKIDAKRIADTTDPRLRGQICYRAGRYADALEAWRSVKAPPGDVGLELEYQRADCLFKVGRTPEALTLWERLVKENANTVWGQQAEFALKVGRAVAAWKTAKGDEGEP